MYELWYNLIAQMCPLR